MSSRVKRRRDGQRSDAAALSFRALDVRASSLDEDGRSVEAVLSTETPVLMFDWERYEYVSEVLLTAGVEYPKSRQIPLLDSHSRFSTANQLGSARALEKTDGGLVGRLHVSAAHEDVFTKIREGHLTDVSVGYKVVERVFVEEGKTKKIKGREFVGPVNVVTKWRVHEVSLTPIGADDQAKLRGLDPGILQGRKGLTMPPELRAKLVERGMPADLDAAAAIRWMADNANDLFARQAPPAPPAPPAAPPAPPATRQAGNDGATATGMTFTPEAIAKLVGDAVDQRMSAQEARRAAARQEATDLCRLAGMEDFAPRVVDLADAAAVRTAIFAERERRATATPTAPVAIYAGEAQRDKHRAALGAALFERVFEQREPASRGLLPEKLKARYAPEKRAAGWEDFRNASLFDLARQCCLVDGYTEQELRSLYRDQIAFVALGLGQQAGVRSSGSIHVTSSFVNLTQDAMNLSLQLGYVEAPSTWERVFRRGTPSPDFKLIHRVRLGGVPNLPIWPDNIAPHRGSMADGQETYAVESRSLTLDFSYKLIVNDSLDALASTIPELGFAARRTVNAVAWSPITGNPLMSDGVALFATATGARKRDNLATGAATPTVATVGAMAARMRLMRGENTPEGNESDVVLNLQPRFIWGPAALETTILQLVNSIADPAASGNAGVYNPARTLEPVIEPLLDANSSKAWYLSCAPTQMATVEITFLAGQENPVITSWVDPETKAINYNVLQTFGSKALNHRGVQKHAGE